MNGRIWSPSPHGWFKLNVDSANCKQHNLTGLGAVVKNRIGERMVVAVKMMRSNGNDEIAEAEGINICIQSGKDSWLLPLIIESDAQKVVNTMNGKASSSNKIFWVLSEIHVSECGKRYESF